MALLRASDVRKMSKEERLKKLEELRAELTRLRLMVKRGTIEDTSKIREVRKAIARILTIEKEEEIKSRSGHKAG